MIVTTVFEVIWPIIFVGLIGLVYMVLFVVVIVLAICIDLFNIAYRRFVTRRNK